MSQEPIISSGDVHSLFQSETLAVIDYIRNFNKQRPDVEAIYKYISITEASNVNQTDIANSIDKLVKQNVLVYKKTNSGYDSFFPYNDNLVSLIPQMELASNSTTPHATLPGSNTNTNNETLSPCKCRSAIFNINSSKNDILKVEA